MADQIRSFRDLRVYQEAFDPQQEIFRISKKWPNEEKHALMDQIRRSSRSIGANIAESWAKRSYPAHFISKLTGADGELQETAHWIATAMTCEYLTQSEHSNFQSRIVEIGKSLGKMMSMPEKFKPQTR
jgi:four helix bundle protein